MTHSKSNGQEVDKLALDTKMQEKLNTLDNLLKLRSKLPHNNTANPKEDENDLEEEEGGLPGYEGIF